MKRVRASRKETIGPVKLYREDMEEIVDLFRRQPAVKRADLEETVEPPRRHPAVEREAMEKIVESFRRNSRVEVQITDGEYLYDSLTEMEKRTGTKVRHLEISRNGWEVVLAIGSRVESLFDFLSPVTLRAPRPSAESEAVYLAVSDYLAKRRWTLGRVLAAMCFAFPVVILLGGVTWARLEGYGRGKFGFPIAIILLLSALASPLVGSLLHTGTFRYVTLKSKREPSTFWARNRDDIWKYVIVAVIGGIIQWVFSHLLK